MVTIRADRIGKVTGTNMDHGTAMGVTADNGAPAKVGAKRDLNDCYCL